MTSNEKIQLWHTGNKYPIGYGCPDYGNSDAAAVTLLNVLVEKGYTAQLGCTGDDRWCCIGKYNDGPDSRLVEKHRSTIASAVTSAILALIESEASNERV